MKSIKYNESNIKRSDVVKSETTRKPKPKNLFSIHPDLDMALDKTTLKNGEIWRMDFWDYTDPDNDYIIDLDRETLKGLAEFIINHLENK